jgi:peptide/nickel transport system permease protein
VWTFLTRRFVQGVVVVVGVMLFVYVLQRAIPGGAARAALGRRATPEQIAAFNHVNAYDRPPWVGFYRYCRDVVLHFDLGYSYKRNEPVASVIGAVLPKTFVLVGLSGLVAVGAALALALAQVVRANDPIDHTISALSFVAYAMPAFLLGQLLVLWFAIDLRWFSTEAPQSTSVWGVMSGARDLVLPVLTLSAGTLALFVRYMRSSLLDQLNADYIRAAKAKGASGTRILLRHALPNALLPIITLLGLSFPAVVGGAVIVETLFNFPGMGLLTTRAALDDDVPLLLGTTLVAAVAAVTGSLIADMLYAVADPRIRRK